MVVMVVVVVVEIVVYGSKTYKIDELSLYSQSQYSINNHYMVVTVTVTDDEKKSFTLNFDYEQIIISDLFIINGRRLIIHSYDKMVWFDLNSGEIIFQHQIDTLPIPGTERGSKKINHDVHHDIDYDIDYEKMEGSNEGDDHFPIATKCYQVDVNIYVKFTNFNRLSDYMRLRLIITVISSPGFP